MSDAPPRDPSAGSWKDGTSRWNVLDPAGEPRGTVFTSVYVADELLVDRGVADDSVFGDLKALAAAAGWQIEQRDLEEPWSEAEGGTGESRSPGASATVRVRLDVAEQSGVVASTPDAWQLLRQARRDGVDRGVSLNHVLSLDSMGLNPFKANPFKANPFKANPFKANPFKANAAGVGMDSYAAPGFGGRQPVTYLGETPHPSGKAERTPVVAVFDTGCGEHPWFRGGVIFDPQTPDGQPIGITDPRTDPERYPSQGRPLEGWLGEASGHGTFIAGIVRQECPDALILPVRIADADGVIEENVLIGALGRLLAYMQYARKKGLPSVDVLNLSFGFFHETPDDPDTFSEVTRLLDEIRALDCVVVCSAGNEATDRPAFPAALAPHDARHVSVGALNPAADSVALFSNIGDWVDVYAPGVSILSTLPVSFQGAVQAGMRDDRLGLRRETLDVDDFRGGFAVWSGTSFAAPVVAGRIAAHMARGTDAAAAADEVVSALSR
jgi:subtilisin family serine protease